MKASSAPSIWSRATAWLRARTPTSRRLRTNRPSTPCSIPKRRAGKWINRRCELSQSAAVPVFPPFFPAPNRNPLPAQTGPAVDITAIVTVTDDGGSSGRLRRQFDVLPPGDIRNCMVALSEDSATLSRLFQYRFEAGRGLKGHNFGNLFLTALTRIMGDFPDAVKASSDVLKIAGRIFPATASNVALEATLANGSRIVGETRISRSKSPISSIRLRPGRAKPVAAALTAIAEADAITLGPGSLFTSVIPNLLV